MSGLSIPQIAITSDSQEWNTSVNNFAENVTDVEDLEEVCTNKIKSKLKININHNETTTDIEDLEASDVENDINTQTITIADFHLDNMIDNIEEKGLDIFGNVTKSLKVKDHELLVLTPDVCLTDIENFATDAEGDVAEVIEPDINLDDYQSDYVKVSGVLKQNSSYLEFSKINVNELTDVESVSSDNEKQSAAKKLKNKRRKSRLSQKSKSNRIDCFTQLKNTFGMKRSLSIPSIGLNQNKNTAAFDSDRELDSLKNTKSNKDMRKTQHFVPNESSAEEINIEFLEGERQDSSLTDDIVLPPAVRTVVLLTDNKSVVPTTKILPLDETRYLKLNHDNFDEGVTDTEFFAEDDIVNVECNQRAFIPDVYNYESSDVHYGENKFNLPKEIIEPLTDTEDLTVGTCPKQYKHFKNTTLHVASLNETGLTDSEDVYLSDTAGSTCKRYNIVKTDDFPIQLCVEESDDYISIKNSSTKNVLNIKHSEVLTSPYMTDVEDLVTSNDEDVESETKVSIEFDEHLEQQRSSKVCIETTRKINLEFPHEIMYLKGGAYRQAHTDVEEISDDNEGKVETKREWDVSKKSALQEEASVTQDAEQQATPNYVTYESVLLRPDLESSSSSPQSYKEIDAMLEKMLVEVEEQENLFSLDFDILELSDGDDSFINTLELIPETDALIEIPIRKSEVYESFREIRIENDSSDDEEPMANLFVSQANVASNESLTDAEDDDYEPVEYNALTHVYQRFDSCPENEIWLEGTYRNLSIVPEEDEEESTSLLSSYSNYRTYSTSSNQYSLCDSVPLQGQSDSCDSQSTDDSDLDQPLENNGSVLKAEIKLLVKTSERGKEAIEIRSVREFLESPPEKSKIPEVKKKSQLSDKFNSLKNKFSSIVDRSKRNLNIKIDESESREDLLKEEKPSFTFQQLFVRTPEPPEGGLQESKRFGSRTELVATSSDRFPLIYDPEISLRDEDVIQEIRNVDLYSNIPFYPCYNRSNVSQYGFKTIPSPQTNPFTETISNPFNESDQIPGAYCDWLEDNSGGLSTTTERLVASNEETLLDKPLGQQLTGLSVIDDYLVTDLKTICEQTNAFIQSESQPEPHDALAEKYTRKDPINDKKVDDNKNNMNEKKKAKKGFFGSIKTFVERSFESDSESEKSPKKSKKPKKEKKKKGKEDIASEQALPPRKPKLPTPPLEPIDIDSIPFVEVSMSDLPPPYKPPDIPSKEQQIPVTDLDVDVEKVELEQKLPAIEKEPEKITKPIIEDKEKGKPKEKSKEKEKKKIKSKTIIVEEVTKTIQPLVIEAEEFSIIVDPTKKESPKKSKETFTINIDESIEKKEKEILEKSPILPEETIMKPIATLEMQEDVPIRPPRIKDHVYEDIEQTVTTIPEDRVKELTTNLIQNEINFGGWSDTPPVQEKVETDDETQKDIVEKHDKEVLKEKDAKNRTDEADTKKKEEKKSGFFALFKKRDSKKEDDAFTGKPEKIEKDKIPALSETAIKNMRDSGDFLSGEVENYQDVRPVTSTEMATTTMSTVTAPIVIEPEVDGNKLQSESFFGLFKKPKKEEKLSVEKKVAVVLSEEVLKNILDSKRFLEGEVQNYHDVKPEVAIKIEEKVEMKTETVQGAIPSKEIVEEPDDKHQSSPKKTADDKREPSPKSSPGFFGLFKKSKKEEQDVGNKSLIQEIKETDQFLVVEVANYHDVKPVDGEKKVEHNVESVQVATETTESQSSGFFGLFKKSKKEDVQLEKPPLFEVTLEDISDTKQFLTDEIQNYHDVRPVIDQTEEKITESADQSSSGFFGLFKKTKKEDEKIGTEITKEVVEIDAESITSKEKPVKIEEETVSKVVEEVREYSPKPTAGFFGLFKKSKKDEEETIPTKPPLSDSVLKDMQNTNQFLSIEIDNYEDTKPEKFEAIEEENLSKVADSSPKISKGMLGIFKKSKGESVEATQQLSETVIRAMNDSEQFLKGEVENYEDVQKRKSVSENAEKPIEPPEDGVESSPKTSRGFFGMFKKTKKESEEDGESKPVTSEAAIQVMNDTKLFLTSETDNYHDVKPEKFEQVEGNIIKSDEEIVETSPKQSRGLFGMFKKSKKNQEEIPEEKPIISERTQKDMADTDAFISVEVKHYDIVAPAREEKIKVEEIPIKVEEALESSTKPSKSFLGMFKKSKKDDEETATTTHTLSDITLREIEQTKQFLSDEVENYQDSKPDKPVEDEKTKKVEEGNESSPKPSRGLFGIFKSPKKEKEETNDSKVVISQDSFKSMRDTDNFLADEVKNYHDVKSVTEENISKAAGETREASPRPTSGLFGIFKKSKKEEADVETKVSSMKVPDIEIKAPGMEILQKGLEETKQTLDENIEKIKDTTFDEKKSKIVDETREASPKPSSGILSVFKKSKKEDSKAQDEEIEISDVEIKARIVEETQKDTAEAQQLVFNVTDKLDSTKLSQKQEEPQTVTTTATQDTEIKSEVKGGFLSKFKKTKKKPSLSDTQLSEDVQKNVDETRNFILTELDNYEDGETAILDKGKREEKLVTFDETKSKMVLEGHLPQPEIPQVVEVVKMEVADAVKETEDEIKEVDVILQEATEIQHIAEPQEITSKRDKDKQIKEKKSFFHRFGKKSKSQETSFEESRGRSEDGEGSPKKQKRRKSSSPFKFFDKMKKSEEEIKESDVLLLSTEPADDAKEETKEDLLTVEFENQPTTDLSKEVLDSLDKKMEELKSKYAPEAQKQINDCRDFLFIEVDNYDGVKPIVVTDIDTGVSTDAGKAVDDIIDKAAKVIEDTKNRTEAIKAETVESVAQITTQVDDSARKTVKKDKKVVGFFSKLGNLISGTTDEIKGELKETKKSAEKMIEKPKEYTQKSIDTAIKDVEVGLDTVEHKIHDTQKAASDKSAEVTDNIKELITTEKINEFSKVKEKFVDTTTKKVDETKQGVLSLKESLLEVAAKTGDRIEDLKISGLNKSDDNTKEDIEKVMDVTETVTTKTRDETAKATNKTIDDKPAKKTTEVAVQDKVVTLIETSTQETDDSRTIEREVVTQTTDDMEKAKQNVIEASATKITEIQETNVFGGIGEVFDSTKNKAEEIRKTKDESLDATKKKVEETKEEIQSKSDGLIDATDAKLKEFVSAADVVKTETKEITADVISQIEADGQERINDLSRKEENVKVIAAQRLDDASIAVTQKIDDLSKTKDSFVDAFSGIKKDFQRSAGQQIRDIKKTQEDVEVEIATKADFGTKATEITQHKIDQFKQVKDSAEEVIVSKIDDLKKTATQKVDHIKEAKQDITFEEDDFIKAATDILQQKKDRVSKTKDSVRDYTEAKAEDLSKIATESMMQKIDEIKKPKDSPESSKATKADVCSKLTAQNDDIIKKPKEDVASKVEEFGSALGESVEQKVGEVKQEKVEVTLEADNLIKKTLETSKQKMKQVQQVKDSTQGKITSKTGSFDKTVSKNFENAIPSVDVEKGKPDIRSKIDVGEVTVKRSIEPKIVEIEKANNEARSKIGNLTKTTAQTMEQKQAEGGAESVVASKIDDFEKTTRKNIEDELEEVLHTTAVLTKDENLRTKDSIESDNISKAIAQDIINLKTSKDISEAEKILQKEPTKKTDDVYRSESQKVEDTKTVFEKLRQLSFASSEKTDNKEQKIDESVEDLLRTTETSKDISAQEMEKMSEKDEDLAKARDTASVDAVNEMSVLKENLAKIDERKPDAGMGRIVKSIEDVANLKKSVIAEDTDYEYNVKTISSEADERVVKTEDVSAKLTPVQGDAIQKAETSKAIAKEETETKMSELEDELVNLTSSLQQLPKSTTETTEKVKSFVTSPTMARRAESQKFSNEERPTVREVKTTHSDDDSDEELYTVTEPEEGHETKRKPLFHLESEEDDSLDFAKSKERRDSVKSNVLETLTENKLDNLLSDLETQLIKDLERSVVEEKEKTESKLSEAEIELEAIKKESQADVEQIEQKLRDLDKALDSLEQASDPKLEKKLHRVERKFERMASEVLETDVGAGVSPSEVEARRENEFQKLVSQLSTEEVSDFQKEYSHLWDETTFSKSDEWDSKTPDSQVDVQELPQGEVVYMGPVTLNKDNLVNKAGVEVDVIPIMRSPCHTPRPTKKNKRAKSALDFYEETSLLKEFDRGSLPDLKRTSLKGSLVNTIIQLNPNRFLYGSATSLRSTASSSSDLSRGEMMSAVLDWLDRSNPMNVSSTETGSITSTDSNLSQMSAKTNQPVPAIRITDGQSKKRSKHKGNDERRETTCAATLTEDIKTVPQPKPRFVKETPLQFKEGRQPKLEKQISPVRDDLLDEDEPAVPETYSDKKKFWENVTKDKRMSLHEGLPNLKESVKKRASVHEVPIPKPRSQIQVSQSIDEAAQSAEDEETEGKIMSEYQASFQPPSEHKPKTPPKVESDKESTDSESDNVVLSGANENAGYISDSGDVEHYISDSEIEDRVPQIRERQMSVFAPPVAAVRKTVYERSASLPTEDLYEVSARSIKLRKQYYEEQIKKEMIEEQLTSEIEEEPSPERKTLISSLIKQMSEERVIVRDIARSFDETTKKEVSFEDDRPTHKPEKSITHTEDEAPISQQISETHKEIDVDSQTKRSSLGSEQSSSSDIDRVTKNGSTSKPDSMEVHVDKSEIEDSEKLADLDQDATDLETKSLDSLNAVEISPKSSTFIDDSIPEITVTLSGKQRRISEESDEYAPKSDKKPELDSPIHVPEEHVEDTVWEVSVQSQPEARFDEKVTSFDGASTEKIEKDEDLSLSTRDESDLGSEIHQDHSDSYASDKIKSESHSDIERIIMDSLQHQKVDPVEAKAIASALIEEIEAEIQRRECLPATTTTTGDVSDYLRYLAETKGLDEREVELVESVLARRQRELAKLSRGDTQASSIEITDEDLRYSGTELDTSHVLEQQISQLKAEKVDDLKSMSFLDKIDEKRIEESHLSKDFEKFDDGVTKGLKGEVHTKTFESIKGEKSETKDTIFEEDETISESVMQESEQSATRIEAITTESSYAKFEDKEVDEYRETSVDVSKEKITEITTKIDEISGEDTLKKKIEGSSQESDVSMSIIKHHVDMTEKSPTEDIKLKGVITCEDYLSKEESAKKETTSEFKEFGGVAVEKEEAVETSLLKTIQKEVVDQEIEETRKHEDEDSVVKQSKTTSKTTKTDVVHESTKVTEITEKVEVVDLEPSFLPSDFDEVKTIVEKHEEIKRTSSSESKSSIESGKSPEDQFSTCSSGRKGDSDSSKVTDKPEVLMRKTASHQKADRKSGIDFETYSSSGESHYHSFELDSGKSRPCSSDVEGLVAAGSSEYESALTSQDYSTRSHITSTEYHTAVSSLSSKESMKSLDSESSGHLGSVEVSELSETLVPSASDAEGDILDAADHLDDGGWGEEIIDEPIDTQSKMKRSYEMTFQPEPKILAAESPQDNELDRKFTSMDDGSIVSMSLSSTSGTTEPRTVIELSRADSERIEGGSMSVSGISDQLSIEGSCDSLVFHLTTTPLVTTDIGTSTGQTESNLQIESITFTTSIVNESGIRNVSTQVTSEIHTPEEDRVTKLEETQINGTGPPEVKKKGHRRQESTSTFVPPILSSFDQKFHSDLTESDKYTAELSFKEVISDEKKDIDEREREESYETEADQGFHRDIREGKYQDAEDEIKDDTPEFSSETQASVGELEQEYTSALARAQEVKRKSEPYPDLQINKEQLDKRDSHGKSSSTSSEKSSFEEAEAEAAFNMVAHVSPAHKIKQICPILEDEDAEKHELETRERAQKEFEKRRSQMRDQSPGSIPDIKVTQHMTPLVDRNFRYPDLELEEQERAKEKEKESETQKSTPQTPSSKSSEDTDQGREYVLEDSGISIPEEATTESRSTVIEQTVKEEADKDTDSPNSDSFEMLEKPDLIDDFVVIEEVAKEAQELDPEGKSVSIHQRCGQKQRARKHDEEIEAYVTRSAPTPLTRMTDVKFYPDGSSSEELGFDFEDSPPINNEACASSYDKELEANKKWIEQQFQGDQAARLAAGYDYEMEFERGPLEDIKEEDINDFDPTSSRIGSLGSQKESGGSLGSVKDSYSSTPEYDVLAGRKYFTRSGEHDDISMSSLQEFENLERAMSLETKRYHQGSQDSSSNGSFKTRYYASKSGQGDDVSVSSLKEFEGLEMACIAAHKIEVKAKEEEAMLAQIDEGQESLASESESCETVSRTDKKIIPDSDEEDYEKRMFEIDEIIRQAQSNVERFIDLKEADKTESLGRGDSIEEVAKVPDLDLDTPIVRSSVKVQWRETENVMVTSTDSINGKEEEKGSHHDSTDSLDQKTGADVMTASTDSIEFQAKKNEPDPINLLSDSIEIKDETASGMISSDSLELAAKQSETMLESTDSLADPTSSTATHATYQYETDSVFSGSFTSGGSNTMVSSTDTIDPVQVDIAVAARKVWFEEDAGSSRKFTTEYVQDTGKPYVTEVIEPSEDDGFSHTIHRRVELPPEVRKITFYGNDADERLKQFIEDFNEGEHVEEVQEVDAAGNVHTRRIVQKRVIIRGDEGPEIEEFVKKSVASKTNELTSFSKETTGEEPDFAATGGIQDSTVKTQATRRRQLRYEISIDDQIEVDPREHDWRFNLPEHAEEESAVGGQQTDRTSSQQKPIADQHQLSEEMKQLLKELEKESKQ